MIYAVAMTDNKLSHRFSKSELFSFYNDQQELIGIYKNPALGDSGCAAKSLVIDLLKKMQCEVVIVRKIGEKTLDRLLSAGFKVEQGNTRNSIDQLLVNAALQKQSLTEPEQGIKKDCSHQADSCCGKH